MMESYFDHKVGGVLLLDRERLTLGEPDHPSLLRDSDGWTLRHRVERARAVIQPFTALGVSGSEPHSPQLPS